MLNKRKKIRKENLPINITMHVYKIHKTYTPLMDTFSLIKKFNQFQNNQIRQSVVRIAVTGKKNE